MAVQRVVLESLGPDAGFRATGDVTGATITVGRPGPDGVPAPRAMELIAMGLGTCMGGVVRSILEKKRIAYSDLRIEIDADRAEDGPMAFRSMVVRISVESDQLDAAALDKIMDLASKNCAAHVTLSHGVPITSESEVRAKP